jgi:single-strand DNA-binding protein
MNKTIVNGHLGRDPEMKYSEAGKPVTRFSMCHTRKFTNGAGKKIEKKTWYNVTVFGAQAEACNQYLKKGREVLIEGRLDPDEHGNPRVYEKKDGGHGASYDLVAESVEFLGGGTDGNGGKNGKAEKPEAEPDEASIPF